MQTQLPDMSPVFGQYEVLMREADAVFARVRNSHGACVMCRETCSDCCHALFDLSLVEAVYLHQAFVEAFPVGPQRSALLERADAADRRVYAIKRKAFKASQEGREESAILAELATLRVRCPLLDDDDRCALYHARPITCRVYGIPTSIEGKGHVCGKSRFRAGDAYPTVNLDRIRQRLQGLNLELAALVGSGYGEIHTVLAPVSMTLLTEYDARYFGLHLHRGARNNG